MVYFDFPSSRKVNLLEDCAFTLKRSPNLLEKDIHVVWALNALFASPVGQYLVFKGGTSLSKGFRIIDRFSEDLDVLLDIRRIIPDLIKDMEHPFPPSRSQAHKWTRIIRERLFEWIRTDVIPILSHEIDKVGMNAKLVQENHVLFMEYETTQKNTGYNFPRVMLEFGAQSTGRPAEYRDVVCDISEALPGLEMPTARPLVILPERTFLEKALAAHVYCLRDKSRGRNHFARHWYDLDCLDQHSISDKAIADPQLIENVIMDERHFYRENDRDGNVIDYDAALSGGISLVPTGKAYDALANDYSEMCDANIIQSNHVPFDTLMGRISDLENRMNTVLGHIPDENDKSMKSNAGSDPDDDPLP